MKILLNQQGFAQVTLSETSVVTEQPTETVNSDTTETPTDSVINMDITNSGNVETASGDSLTSDSSNDTAEGDDTTKIVHKDAPTTDPASTDAAETTPAEELPTAVANTDDQYSETEGTANLNDADAEKATEGAENTEGTGDGTTGAEGETSDEYSEPVMMGGSGGGGYEDDMTGMEGATTQKSSVMSSWPFVIGISSATLVVSIVLGILFAKKRIKKGFDSYED